MGKRTAREGPQIPYPFTARNEFEQGAWKWWETKKLITESENITSNIIAYIRRFVNTKW